MAEVAVGPKSRLRCARCNNSGEATALASTKRPPMSTSARSMEAPKCWVLAARLATAVLAPYGLDDCSRNSWAPRHRMSAKAWRRAELKSRCSQSWPGAISALSESPQPAARIYRASRRRSAVGKSASPGQVRVSTAAVHPASSCPKLPQPLLIAGPESSQTAPDEPGREPHHRHRSQ